MPQHSGRNLDPSHQPPPLVLLWFRGRGAPVRSAASGVTIRAVRARRDAHESVIGVTPKNENHNTRTLMPAHAFPAGRDGTRDRPPDRRSLDLDTVAVMELELLSHAAPARARGGRRCRRRRWIGVRRGRRLQISGLLTASLGPPSKGPWLRQWSPKPTARSRSCSRSAPLRRPELLSPRARPPAPAFRRAAGGPQGHGTVSLSSCTSTRTQAERGNARSLSSDCTLDARDGALGRLPNRADCRVIGCTVP